MTQELDFLPKLAQLSSEQIELLIQGIGALPIAAQWEPIAAGRIASVLLRQALTLFEVAQCFVDLKIENADWDSPLLYTTGEGTRSGETDEDGDVDDEFPWGDVFPGQEIGD